MGQCAGSAASAVTSAASPFPLRGPVVPLAYFLGLFPDTLSHRRPNTLPTSILIDVNISTSLFALAARRLPSAQSNQPHQPASIKRRHGPCKANSTSRSAATRCRASAASPP
ncbi:hypothetical protein PSAC2689_10682 [Paraburkholderia sacchari]